MNRDFRIIDWLTGNFRERVDDLVGIVLGQTVVEGGRRYSEADPFQCFPNLHEVKSLSPIAGSELATFPLALRIRRRGFCLCRQHRES